MTKNLERAFAEASKLPESDQDALARWILAELASDRKWEDAFSASHEKLGKMGRDAVREHRDGRTKPLDPDRL